MWYVPECKCDNDTSVLAIVDQSQFSEHYWCWRRVKGHENPASFNLLLSA